MKKKTQMLMNKPVYLGLSVLEWSKIVIYEFCYDYAKPKYEEKTKPHYIYGQFYCIHVKTDDIYKTLLKIMRKGLIL